MSIVPARRAALRALGSVALLAALAACKDRPAFQGSSIEGTHLGKDVAMVDQDGKPRAMADFAGKVVVAFFGYTHCPDVCPTSLAELAQVMQTLGPDASRVQVVMITVDPERDTPEVMKQYVTTFNPGFVGLTGSLAQLKTAATSFKAYYAKVPTKDGSDYSMDHSAAFYLLDQKGEAQVLVNNNAGADVLVHDIKLLLG
ncbi:SCO family protein [Bordetella genomosp. 10]|uniref:SCO family protein n=1 Tax=Bordetella genomosp. 10 TaxID=1416804 RepID=A0A261SJI0_9BORD|nr:SCO family protein [Bordetella genomosp. 10]OZI36920.1 SCO family protein [Bordetella genomosp. 10]